MKRRNRRSSRGDDPFQVIWYSEPRRVGYHTAKRYLTDPIGSGSLVNDEHIHCRRCRYNLTGCESLRCPECGTPFNRQVLLDPLRNEGIACPDCGLNLSGYDARRCPACGREYDRSALLRRRRWFTERMDPESAPVAVIGSGHASADALWPDDFGHETERLKCLRKSLRESRWRRFVKSLVRRLRQIRGGLDSANP